jgi:hypothetical protein
MPTVASFTCPGLDLWFNSNDHLAEHFHAEKSGAWEVRVFFLRDEEEMFELKWTRTPRRPSQRDLRELAKLVSKHRPELLEEWESKVNQTSPPGRDER